MHGHGHRKSQAHFCFAPHSVTRRRKKKHISYIESLKIGDNVVTDSGIYGRVVSIKDETVTLVLKKGEIDILKSKILHT